MGKCIYCNKEAGFLKSEHPECKKLHQEALAKKAKELAIAKENLGKDIANGKFPDFSSQDIPVMLQKNEKVAWIFEGVRFSEVRTRTTYKGSSQGISFKVVGSLRYRTGEFKGEPVVNTTLTPLDTGRLIITNQGLYFTGSLKKHRIKYKDVMEFKPYSNAIGVTKNTGSAKPQTYEVGEENGEFAYTIVMALAQTV
jgi:hypothetical protein